MALLIFASVLQIQVSTAANPRETVREKVCKQHFLGAQGEPFKITTVPTMKRQNESGVLLLINCSNRKVVSLRDPSRSRRHVREFVYIPDFLARMRRDPYGYEVLNFNEEVHNTAFEHTAYSSEQNWTGPCFYPGLELTTISPLHPDDRRTIKFDLNICHNLIVALLTPAQPGDSVTVFPDILRRK